MVFQVIRQRQQATYRWTLWVRLFFCVGTVALFILSQDPFFLVLLGILVVGIGPTIVGLLFDHNRKRDG